METQKVEFKGLIQFMEIFNTEEKCREHLRKILYPKDPICKCGRRMSYSYSEESRKNCLQGYRCSNCSKAMALLRDTMFNYSKTPLRKWFIAIYVFTVNTNGISSPQLGKLIDVHKSTAYYMLQKMRISLQNTNLNKKLCGHVEADETYVGGANTKKGSKRGRGSMQKIVFGSVERKGRVYAKVVPNCSSKSLQPIIYKKIRKRAKLYTDGWAGYRGLKGFTHFRVKHKDSMFATVSIEGFWNHLKSTIRTYRGVSLKHLQKYVNEVAFRYNFRRHQLHETFDVVLHKCFGFNTRQGMIDVPYILD